MIRPKILTSDNIIFKQRLLWSLGLRMNFGEESQQTTPPGFMNTGTLYVIEENN